MTETKKLYYGDQEILDVVEGAEEGLKRVTLAPSPTNSDPDKVAEVVDIYDWELECVSKDKPTSASDVRNYKAVKVVDAIYDVLTTYNIHVEDLAFITQKLLSKAQERESVAINNLFGTTDVRISDWEKQLL